MKNVLMVAEKPNLARTIASILSKRRSQRGYIDETSTRSLPLFEWVGEWPETEETVRFKMTSTYGHIKEMKFEPAFENDWRRDPEDLFSCGVVKQERDPGARVADQLKKAGHGIDYLVLWLDCDREGENICYEVIDIVLPQMRRPHNTNRVFRANFSALTDLDIWGALYNLDVPDEKIALSVDARMELDLRIGCAFTRLQTKYFVHRYGKEKLGTNVISFGPCQTPTLGFCVSRHEEIENFESRQQWWIDAGVSVNNKVFPLKWERKATFNRHEADETFRELQKQQYLQVTDITSKMNCQARPTAINTLQLLRLASSELKISPSETMEIAEWLYMGGFISYPRTETTKYPATFDRTDALGNIASNRELRRDIQYLMEEDPDCEDDGFDAGDHPPITPLKDATDALRNNQRNYAVYQLICRHFLASLAANSKYIQKTALFIVGGQKFFIDSLMVTEVGFTRILKGHRKHEMPTFELSRKSKVTINYCSVKNGLTVPPDYLTEGDLIDMMESHRIGTDASIPLHIQNIFNRNFVKLDAERHIIPTPMGIALIEAYNALDEELAKPDMRSELEAYLDMIADGEEEKQTIVDKVLGICLLKYQLLADNLDVMDGEIRKYLNLHAPHKRFRKTNRRRNYGVSTQAVKQRGYDDDYPPLPQVPGYSDLNNNIYGLENERPNQSHPQFTAPTTTAHVLPKIPVAPALVSLASPQVGSRSTVPIASTSSTSKTTGASNVQKSTTRSINTGLVPESPAKKLESSAPKGTSPYLVTAGNKPPSVVASTSYNHPVSAIPQQPVRPPRAAAPALPSKPAAPAIRPSANIESQKKGNNISVNAHSIKTSAPLKTVATGKRQFGKKKKGCLCLIC